MALKLDMSKAFDRVEWAFIDAVMRKMGFSDGWVRKIMNCISSRGLRQGDPLSPFLFLFCSEGFPCLLKKMEADGRIHGLKFSCRDLFVSYLLFAVDSFIFLEAKKEECEALKVVLDLYEAASGQMVNLEKSEACFGIDVKVSRHGSMVDFLKIKVVDCHEKYLGLPTFAGMCKRDLLKTESGINSKGGTC
ncbi:hypothetical protein UlMin_019025 [Ulmus minor]